MPREWFTRSVSEAVLFPPDKSPLPSMEPVPNDKVNVQLGLVAGGSKRMARRPYQEDYFDLMAAAPDARNCNAFGVFDGHGGDSVAKYLSTHINASLVKAVRLAAPDEIRSAVQRAYTDTDETLRGLGFARNCGSCAVSAQVVGDALLVANTGDCEAWLSRGGEPVELSIPHKATNPTEKERIQAAGGCVMFYDGQARAAGVLAVTRAFGDESTKQGPGGQGITAEPHISVLKLQPDDEFLILGSDGLFDKFPHRQNLMNEAKRLLRETRSPRKAAQALVDMVVERLNGTDNTTAAIIVFNHGGKTTATARAFGREPGLAVELGCTTVRPRSRSVVRELIESSTPRAERAAGAAFGHAGGSIPEEEGEEGGEEGNPHAIARAGTVVTITDAQRIAALHEAGWRPDESAHGEEGEEGGAEERGAEEGGGVGGPEGGEHTQQQGHGAAGSGAAQTAATAEAGAQELSGGGRQPVGARQAVAVAADPPQPPA